MTKFHAYLMYGALTVATNLNAFISKNELENIFKLYRHAVDPDNVIAYNKCETWIKIVILLQSIQ